MKRRLAVSLVVLAVALAGIVWRAVEAQSAHAPNPFLDGLAGKIGGGGSVYFRQVNGGGYAEMQVSETVPYGLLSSMSVVTQLVANGLKNLAAAPAGPSGVGRQSQVFAFGDFSGTGNLGVAQCGGSVVVVYHSTAGVLYGGQVTYQIGPDVNSVALADFNGDGKVDMAVAFDGDVRTTPGGIAILLGKGDGTFGSPQNVASGTPATRFAVLDVNHDGKLDIVTAALSQTATVLIGKGDGTFNAPVSYAVGGSGQAIALADIDGDGNPDIIVGGAVGVMLGNGDGTFHNGTPLPAVASGNLIWSFAAGDLNNDGKMDLVFADIENQVAVPLFGNGLGAFQVGQAYAVSALPDSLMLLDYNNDGRLDIVNASGDARILLSADQSGAIDILLNNGDGTFQGAPSYFALPNAEAAGNFYLLSAVATGNFGGVAGSVLTAGTGALTLFKGNGKGGFQAPTAVAYSGPIGSLAAGDFNGDGKADVAMAAGSSVAILLSNSSGGLTPLANAGTGGSPEALAAADFDGDGHIDLAALNYGTPGTLTVVHGVGDGSFGNGISLPAGSSPTQLTAVDVNSDGRLDLVFADNGNNGVGGAIYVAINQGGGSFHPPVKALAVNFGVFGIGDVDGDGKPDLIAAGQVGNGNTALYFLHGNGDGTFLTAVPITTSQDNDSAVLVRDFNGDGRADIVLAHQTSNAVFLAGNGDGTFYNTAHPTQLLGPAQPILLASTDLNGDGRPDLLIGGFTLAVLLNNGAPAADVYSSAYPGSMTLAPGSLGSAFGTDLANQSPGSASLPLPLSFGGSSISIVDSTGTSFPAPLLYVNTSQINFEVPAGVASGAAQVVISSGDGTKSTGNVAIQPVAPGLFTFNTAGLAAAYVIVYHADGTNTFEPVYAVSGSNIVAQPVSLGSGKDQPYLFLFGTGIAAAGTGGVKVTVGGANQTVQFAGPQGVYVGLDQVNVPLPLSLAGKGNVSIQLTANGIAANPVNITIQ